MPSSPTEPERNLLLRFPQLFPCLDKLLHGSRCGEGTAVNDSTIAVRTLIKVEHCMRIQAGEVLAQLFQMLTAEHIFGFVELRPPSHDGHGSTRIKGEIGGPPIQKRGKVQPWQREKSALSLGRYTASKWM